MARQCCYLFLPECRVSQRGTSSGPRLLRAPGPGCVPRGSVSVLIAAPRMERCHRRGNQQSCICSLETEILSPVDARVSRVSDRWYFDGGISHGPDEFTWSICRFRTRHVRPLTTRVWDASSPLRSDLSRRTTGGYLSGANQDKTASFSTALRKRHCEIDSFPWLYSLPC